MRIKFLYNFIIGVIALVVLLGFMPVISQAQIIAPTGNLTTQSSQLVYWYDVESFEDFGGLEDGCGNVTRETFVQLTNASLTDSVCVHVQIFTNFRFDSGGECNAVTRCLEQDFVDCYTPGDTHVYDLEEGEIKLNFTKDEIPAELDFTKGFVVITPIDKLPTDAGTDFTAISFQHLMGHSFIITQGTDGGDYGYRVNAMGRDARSFLPGGGIAPDGTELDGVAAGYVLLQPEILKFNFAGLPNIEAFFTGDPTGFEENVADVVSIAFIDSYTGGIAGGYEAKRGAAQWDVLLFDDDETPVSCDTQIQDCFFDIGINDSFPPADTLLDGDRRLCTGNAFFIGWAQLFVTGLDPFENELGLIGIATDIPLGNIGSVGGADWMHAE